MTTRNSQQGQFNEEFDNVTVKIRTRQGHDCATKVQVRDKKKKKMAHTRSAILPRKPEHARHQ